MSCQLVRPAVMSDPAATLHWSDIPVPVYPTNSERPYSVQLEQLHKLDVIIAISLFVAFLAA